MKAYVQLGKLGDCISILPILQREFETTKVPVPLVISKDYASILEGVSYVEPVIFKGDAGNLADAVLFAKKRFSQVVVTQTFGNLPVQHQTPSFQFDQWKRAGCLDKWEDLPLTFDRRNTDSESALIGAIFFSKPVILFADHSQSSPFIHKEELYTMLVKEFGHSHDIQRLSEIRAPRIFDMIGAMNHAAALVTVETAHLHLSKASKVPTFALAAPGWRGSAFSKRFKFFMRYVEWESRKLELIHAIRAILDGKETGPKIKKMDTVKRHGYNLSHIEVGEFDHHCYRAHPWGDWRTKLFIDEYELNLPPRYKDHSHEDLRFFEFNSKLHGVYVVSTAIDGFFRCYVAYGEIKGNQIDHIQINHPENNLLGMTKNFVPFVHDGKLYFLYGIKGDNQIALHVHADKVVSEYKAPAPKWGFGEIRGGCIIPHAGAYLRFFHSRAQYSDKTLRYFVGASIIETKPPFKTLAVSKRPILQGDERYTPGCHHWKGNVAIPYGVIERDGKFLLSYGRNDAECCIAELTEGDLNL